MALILPRGYKEPRRARKSSGGVNSQIQVAVPPELRAHQLADVMEREVARGRETSYVGHLRLLLPAGRDPAAGATLLLW